jgi:hypothetical protein
MWSLRRAMDTADKTRRAAIVFALRRLRISIAHGRPMTLPNLLRLYRRRAVANPLENDIWQLQQLYVQHQPFGQGLHHLRF